MAALKVNIMCHVRRPVEGRLFVLGGGGSGGMGERKGKSASDSAVSGGMDEMRGKSASDSA
ncbi:hypothetical protein R70723_26605 [Paenibacillus sp. FSL R7-0273]|nr:hypothetical protein R70723_26605 [Paenibacillus sp. FSL R7-0273]